MRLYPFEVWLLGLSGRQFPYLLLTKERAYLELKEASGQDFGYGVKRWAAWGLSDPDTVLRKRCVRSALDIPTALSVDAWFAQNDEPQPTAQD